jgi:acetyl-CoA acetyltransferase
LHDVLPVDLLAHSLKELVNRTGIDPAQIDDVIAGAVTQVGDQAVNIARNAVLGAGFPESVPGTTVDRQCGSSQQAISFAAQGVISGAYDIVIACGCRVDGPGADGLERAAGQRSVRRDGAALPRRPCAAGHQRGVDRREMGLSPDSSSTSSPRAATKRPRGNQRGSVRQ